MGEPITRWDGRVKPIGVCLEPGCWDRPKEKDPRKRYHDKIVDKERYSAGVCFHFRCDRGHTWDVSVLVSDETAERMMKG